MEQTTFLEDDILTCETEWDDMPEYNNRKQDDPLITATFKFTNEEDYLKFKDLVQEHIYQGEKVFDGMQKKEAKTSWYPHKEKASKFSYKRDDLMNPRFPVYIVSKNRWERNPTSRALKEMMVPFFVVVEESQFDDYKQTLKFVNDVAKISEKLDHHPDIFFNYDTVRIEVYSHSHKAVTTKDIEFAKDVSKK